MSHSDLAQKNVASSPIGGGWDTLFQFHACRCRVRVMDHFRESTVFDDNNKRNMDGTFQGPAGSQPRINGLSSSAQEQRQAGVWLGDDAYVASQRVMQHRKVEADKKLYGKYYVPADHSVHINWRKICAGSLFALGAFLVLLSVFFAHTGPGPVTDEQVAWWNARSVTTTPASKSATQLPQVPTANLLPERRILESTAQAQGWGPGTLPEDLWGCGPHCSQPSTASLLLHASQAQDPTAYVHWVCSLAGAVGYNVRAQNGRCFSDSSPSVQELKQEQAQQYTHHQFMAWAMGLAAAGCAGLLVLLLATGAPGKKGQPHRAGSN